jgi:hypothetical protein
MRAFANVFVGGDLVEFGQLRRVSRFSLIEAPGRALIG